MGSRRAAQWNAAAASPGFLASTAMPARKYSPPLLLSAPAGRRGRGGSYALSFFCAASGAASRDETASTAAATEQRMEDLHDGGLPELIGTGPAQNKAAREFTQS